MGQFLFYVLDQNENPLPGVVVGHSTQACAHDNECPRCGDVPFVREGPPQREWSGVVGRQTDQFGHVHFEFGTCDEPHDFFYSYPGQPLETIQVGSMAGRQGIVIRPPVPPPAPEPPEEEPVPPPAPEPPEEEPAPPPAPGDLPEDEGLLSGPVGFEQTAHACSFSPTKTTSGPCKRRTRDANCYQHVKGPTPDMKEFAGTWIMNGRQAIMPSFRWEARLKLEADGRLTWEETDRTGSVRRRNGRWEMDGSVLRMRYWAPEAGPVDWEAGDPKSTGMSGIYRTPEVDTKGPGWGGEWSATRMTA